MELFGFLKSRESVTLRRGRLDRGLKAVKGSQQSAGEQAVRRAHRPEQVRVLSDKRATSEHGGAPLGEVREVLGA